MKESIRIYAELIAIPGIFEVKPEFMFLIMEYPPDGCRDSNIWTTSDPKLLAEHQIKMAIKGTETHIVNDRANARILIFMFYLQYVFKFSYLYISIWKYYVNKNVIDKLK